VDVVGGDVDEVATLLDQIRDRRAANQVAAADVHADDRLEVVDRFLPAV